MTIKPYKSELILVFITVSIVALMLLFNNINQEIRIKELKVFLQKSEREDNNFDHIGLVMKYRLARRLYENQISEENADMVEVKVNSLLSEAARKDRVQLREYRMLSIPALHTINFLRFLLGKGPIKDYNDAKSNIYLEVAYFYERNKFYDKALEIYDKALGEKPDRKTAAGIILHKGFCQSILGNYKDAKGDYNTVIRDYSDEKAAITAAILLRYLEGFRSEAVRIIEHENDSVVKGEKLYKLIAYRESLDVLQKIEKDADPKERSEIRFVKARCMEELAEKEKAVNIYQKIIKEDTKSEYAKMANRRVFIIGSLSESGAGLRERAAENNEVLQDETFKKMADQVARIEKMKAAGPAATDKILENTLKGFEEHSPVIDEKKIDSYEELNTANPSEKGRVKKREKLQTVKIYTTDGNIFVGSVLRETDSAVYLKTMIGKVNIEKSRILKRESR